MRHRMKMKVVFIGIGELGSLLRFCFQEDATDDQKKQLIKSAKLLENCCHMIPQIMNI